MSEKKRTNHTAEEKVAILRKHLLEKIPVSEVCEKHGIHPTIFYRWQKQLFEQGAAAFGTVRKADTSAQEQKIAALEAKLERKNEVLSELMEEYVTVKKELGEL